MAATRRLAGESHGRAALRAVIVSQLLLRVGSAAGGLVVGSYFAQLRSHGVGTTSLLLGVVSGLAYVAELVLAPLAGAASDRRGRRVFLVAAPLVAAIGVVLVPGGSVVAAVPPLGLVLVVVAVARVIEGSGDAMAVPATLGLLADATDADRVRRGRVMSFYELTSAGGIAVGAALGPALWSVAGLWSCVVIAAFYLLAGGVVVAGPVVLVGIFLEAGFAPAALTYLARLSVGADRGLVIGMYSVVLGAGYLIGNVAGGAFAQWLAFDGLAVLTIVLAVGGLVSIAATRVGA